MDARRVDGSEARRQTHRSAVVSAYLRVFNEGLLEYGSRTSSHVYRCSQTTDRNGRGPAARGRRKPNVKGPGSSETYIIVQLRLNSKNFCR